MTIIVFPLFKGSGMSQNKNQVFIPKTSQLESHPTCYYNYVLLLIDSTIFLQWMYHCWNTYNWGYNHHIKYHLETSKIFQKHLTCSPRLMMAFQWINLLEAPGGSMSTMSDDELEVTIISGRMEPNKNIVEVCWSSEIAKFHANKSPVRIS